MLINIAIIIMASINNSNIAANITNTNITPKKINTNIIIDTKIKKKQQLR